MYIPKEIGRIHRDPLLFASGLPVMAVVGLLIFYVIPAEMFLTMPFLGSFIEWVSGKIPSIARWVELSEFPKAAKVFAVFVWVCIPIQVLLIVSCKPARETFFEKGRNRSLLGNVFDLLRVLFVVAVLLVPGFLFAAVDTPPCLICVNSSEAAMLFIGCVFAISISGGVGVCVWYCALIVKALKR